MNENPQMTRSTSCPISAMHIKTGVCFRHLNVMYFQKVLKHASKNSIWFQFQFISTFLTCIYWHATSCESKLATLTACLPKICSNIQINVLRVLKNQVFLITLML